MLQTKVKGYFFTVEHVLASKRYWQDDAPSYYYRLKVEALVKHKMHLDLTSLLPEQVTANIGGIAQQYGAYCPQMLWPLWLQHVDISKTPVNVLQAAAQLLSSYNCVIATLRFGLYCSRHFPCRGNVISDDVALHYLRLAFQLITQSQQQEGLMKWLQQAEGFDYVKEQRELFWVHACVAFAQHEYRPAIGGNPALTPSQTNPQLDS